MLGEQENNIELVQKRWKQLRNSYVKAKRKVTEYIPSGSASCSKTSKIQGFSLYNQMKFLDVAEKSSTITSLSKRTNTEHDIELIEDQGERGDQSPLRVIIPQTSNTSVENEQSSWASNSSSSNQQQKKKNQKFLKIHQI